MENIADIIPPSVLELSWLALLAFPLFIGLLLFQSARARRASDAYETKLADLRASQQEEIKKLVQEHEQSLAELNTQHAKDLERYSAIISLEEEILRLESDRKSRCLAIENEVSALTATRRETETQIDALRASYKEKRATYDRLKRELAVFDDRLSFAELGVYEPHFDFGDSEAFKAAIKAVREEQKAMVKSKTAVFCTTTWTVDGSQSKGETMSNRAIRLTLRAFNNECEAAIANTRWNNVHAMERRIERAMSAINSLNKSNAVIISADFFDQKLKELRLTHEYREKLKQERDERAEVARQEREEKRLVQEAKAAEREEKRYLQLLEKARAEAGVISSEEHARKLKELEEQLELSHAKTERAKAMAEQTKSGFVYIISNVGSFGEDVIKIGLTRRVDPADRVKELGDASVPFLFDTHAMIYSDEAPALEAALHNEFAARRVNAANVRKEFFRATIEEVEEAVRRLAPDADFHTDVEAQEYFETLARRQELADRLADAESNQFPAEI